MSIKYYSEHKTRSGYPDRLCLFLFEVVFYFVDVGLDFVVSFFGISLYGRFVFLDVSLYLGFFGFAFCLVSLFMRFDFGFSLS